MRVYFIKKARQGMKLRKCVRCSEEIKIGEPYRFITPRFGGKRCFCQKHPPRQSDLTGGKLGELYGIQEGLEDDLVSFQRDGEVDMEASLSEAADEADRIADEYEGSIQNMPDSLQQSPVAEECQERAEASREWAEELRGVTLPEEPGETEAESEGEEDEEEDEAMDTWRDEVVGEVETAVSALQI
ncbi:hypothetical protein LCGC14_1839490 [marine sediment metagenome]|uniref:Uncharacterized protein n=1 Tax=marine sediment metagenome TaxID=412755 RepID=A0A0F9IT32_9ZZZZ